jgi:hypothetical protein
MKNEYTKEDWAKWFAHKSNKEIWCENEEKNESDYSFSEAERSVNEDHKRATKNYATSADRDEII